MKAIPTLGCASFRLASMRNRPPDLRTTATATHGIAAKKRNDWHVRIRIERAPQTHNRRSGSLETWRNAYLLQELPFDRRLLAPVWRYCRSLSVSASSSSASRHGSASSHRSNSLSRRKTSATLAARRCLSISSNWSVGRRSRQQPPAADLIVAKGHLPCEFLNNNANLQRAQPLSGSSREDNTRRAGLMRERRLSAKCANPIWTGW